MSERYIIRPMNLRYTPEKCPETGTILKDVEFIECSILEDDDEEIELYDNHHPIGRRDMIVTGYGAIVTHPGWNYYPVIVKPASGSKMVRYQDGYSQAAWKRYDERRRK